MTSNHFRHILGFWCFSKFSFQQRKKKNIFNFKKFSKLLLENTHYYNDTVINKTKHKCILKKWTKQQTNQKREKSDNLLNKC